MCIVRWYDPARGTPLTRWFHRKADADAFRERLPYLSEPPGWKPDPKQPGRYAMRKRRAREH